MVPAAMNLRRDMAKLRRKITYWGVTQPGWKNLCIGQQLQENRVEVFSEKRRVYRQKILFLKRVKFCERMTKNATCYSGTGFGVRTPEK